MLRLGIFVLSLVMMGGTMAHSCEKYSFNIAFPPGGIVDEVARVVAQGITANTGKPVVLENHAGASGNNIAKSLLTKKESCSILVTSDALVINERLYRNKGFSAREFTPIAIPALTPQILVANADSNIKSLGDVIGKNPTLSTAGYGSGSYVSMEYFFMRVLKSGLTQVPFQGGAPAITAVLGGHVDLMAGAIGGMVTEQIMAGKLRGLGISTMTRRDTVPSVPTFGESGYPFQISSWVGFFVPSSISEVTTELNAEIRAVLRNPTYAAKLKKMSFDIVEEDVATTNGRFHRDLTIWGSMVDDTGLRVD